MNGKALIGVALALAATAGLAAVFMFGEPADKPKVDGTTAQAPTTATTQTPSDIVTPPTSTNGGTATSTPPVDGAAGIRTATSADDYSAEGALRVKGKVFDLDTQKGIPEAEVEILYPDGTPIESAFSNDDGTFELEIHEGIPPAVDFRAKAEGYAACVKSAVRITKSVRDVSLDFELRPGFRIEGRVTSVSGSPVADAQVNLRSLMPMFEDEWETVDTDPNGYYSFEPIESFSPEGFDLYVESIDHVPQVKSGLSVAPGQLTLRVDFKLLEALKLRGRIVDADGQPVAGASITIASPDPEYADDAEDETSADDGTFEYEGNVVPVENIFVLITATDQAAVRIDSIPAAGGDGVSDLGTIQLGRMVHVTGFVVTQGTGGVVSGGDISFCADGAPGGADGEYTDSAQIGPNGHFELDLENTPPGKALVMIEAKDSLETTQVIDIANQPTVSLQLAVDPVIVISGTVTRKQDGSPIPGARVRVVGAGLDVDESELSARVRADGGYRIELPSSVNTAKLQVVVEYAGKRNPMGALPAANSAFQVQRDFTLDVPAIPKPQPRAAGAEEPPRSATEMQERLKKMREEQEKKRAELEKDKKDGG